MPDPSSPATRLVHAGRPDPVPGAAVSPPVTFTSTFRADGPVDYGRGGNPTWTAFEAAIGDLEGGDALVFASGMGAIAAVMSLLAQGGVLVAPASAYSGTVVLVDELEARGAAVVRRVDIADTSAVAAALDGAGLLWIESPTNPLMAVADLPALIAAGHTADVLIAVDNTFATPLLQQPLALGADIVVHSATKYISGHSDVILGVAVTAPTAAGRAAYERLASYRRTHGAIAGPMEVWLALRGLRTMHLRVERACANAAALVPRLEGHPAVTRVRYPGFGAMVSIEVDGDGEAAERVCAATRIWVHSTSLGGVESQLERRRRHPLEPHIVPENLLRLSVGIEDAEDLWRDIARALDQA
ncbi:MAG: PLP-dependent aspartate aminotransferase family protein [Nostocoides sp.]